MRHTFHPATPVEKQSSQGKMRQKRLEGVFTLRRGGLLLAVRSLRALLILVPRVRGLTVTRRLFASFLQPNQSDGQPPGEPGLRLSPQRGKRRGHVSGNSIQAGPEEGKPGRAGAADTESRRLVGSTSRPTRLCPPISPRSHAKPPGNRAEPAPRRAGSRGDRPQRGPRPEATPHAPRARAVNFPHLRRAPSPPAAGREPRKAEPKAGAQPTWVRGSRCAPRPGGGGRAARAVHRGARPGRSVPRADRTAPLDAPAPHGPAGSRSPTLRGANPSPAPPARPPASGEPRPRAL